MTFSGPIRPETRSTYPKPRGREATFVRRPAGAPVPRSHWLEVPSPGDERPSLATPALSDSDSPGGGAGRRGGASWICGSPGRLRRGGEFPAASLEAGPGLYLSRVTGRANARPGPPSPETWGWEQWASSWCVTGEFLKGEVSGATRRTRGAAVGGGDPRALK